MIASPIDEMRRKIMFGLTVGPFLVKNAVLETIWRSTGGDTTIGYRYAVSLACSVNTYAMGLRGTTQVFPPLEAIMGQLALDKTHSTPGDAAYVWMSKLDFNGPQILPGWTMTYSPKGNSYLLIIQRSNMTIISDDTGVVYVSDTVAPSYKGTAKNFPGAVCHSDYKPHTPKLRDTYS